MPSMNFRVLNGTHSINGRRYEKGDVVPADVDLVAQFPGVFIREHDQHTVASAGKPETKAGTALQVPEVNTGSVPQVPVPPGPNADAKKEADTKDAAEGVKGAKDALKRGSADDRDDADAETSEPAEEPVSYGDDVTTDFPDAGKDVQVFKNDAGKYTVVRGQEVIASEVTKVAAKAAVKSKE